MDIVNAQDYKNITWIENLAIDEINMEESGVIRFNDHIKTEEMIEESSIHFMNQLRDRFEFFVSLFNQYRGKNDQSRQIKIFKISNTVNDFILFRSSLKLIVARKSIDTISIGFLQQSGAIASSLGSEDQLETHEIKAHVGPFNEVTWRYHGEQVKIESIIKYYLSEFITNSSR